MNNDFIGDTVSMDAPEYHIIKEKILDTKIRIQEMNTQVLDCEGVREYFAKITETEKNDTLNLVTPFYTDYGKNIRIGKNVFINFSCVFMDRGGIVIGDNVFIGPRVSLITLNHGLAPEMRRTLISLPIELKDNVWVGAGAIVLPGVTIGENSIVGAGAVVTKDVPPNAVVVGNPARILKYI